MALQPCRECGQEVSTEARTCPKCGVPGPTTEPGQDAVGDAAGISTDRLRQVAYLGVGLQVIGVFSPIMSVPVIGDVNYFRDGGGDGVIVLFMALMTAALVYRDRLSRAWIPAAISALILCYTFFSIREATGNLRREAASQSSDLASGLTTLMAESVQLEWGFGVLVLGTGLVLVAGLVAHGSIRTPDTTPSETELVAATSYDGPHRRRKVPPWVWIIVLVAAVAGAAVAVATIDSRAESNRVRIDTRR